MSEPWNGGPWPEGYSGNRSGRPPGKPNAATLALQEKLKNKTDALDVLITIMKSEAVSVEKRIAAASVIARYQHAPAPRLIRKPVDVPVAMTVEQAIHNIAVIGNLAARRKIGLDEARDLVDIQKAFVEMQIGVSQELRLTVLEQYAAAHPIPNATVEGGLPPLPPATLLPKSASRNFNLGSASAAYRDRPRRSGNSGGLS